MVRQALPAQHFMKVKISIELFFILILTLYVTSETQISPHSDNVSLFIFSSYLLIYITAQEK